MSMQSPAEIARKRDVLYQTPTERLDTCGRCRYSTATLQGKSADKTLRCRVVGGEVRAGGCCAAWRPPAGRVIELRVDGVAA